MMYSFGSFSDMIFYFEYVLFPFLMSTFYIFCVDVCYAFDMRHIFTLASLITWVWPIMEDIESIDLGSWDRPRKFETMTHFILWLEQYHIYIHIHIRTLALWTWWPIHFEPDMTPPLDTITRLYYPCSPYHATVPLPFISIISLIWLGRVRDG